MNVFDYVRAINQTKEEIDDMSAYVPFVVNRQLSYFPDTVFYSNEMNMCQIVPEKAQFEFFLNSIAKAKRFSKWEKPQENETLELIKQYFGYGTEKAKQAIRLLSSEQIDLIRKKIKGLEDGKPNR